MLGSDEDSKLGSIDGKTIKTLSRNVDGITLWVDARTDLGRLDRFCNGSNGDKLGGLLI